MESHDLQDMLPKPLTTPERHGAGMAHTVASTSHVLYCSYCGTIMDYPGLSWIIVDYDGLWTMVDYHGLSWIMDYHGLAWLEGLIMDYGLSMIMDS